VFVILERMKIPLKFFRQKKSTCLIGQAHTFKTPLPQKTNILYLYHRGFQKNFPLTDFTKTAARFSAGERAKKTPVLFGTGGGVAFDLFVYSALSVVSAALSVLSAAFGCAESQAWQFPPQPAKYALPSSVSRKYWVWVSRCLRLCQMRSASGFQAFAKSTHLSQRVSTSSGQIKSDDFAPERLT